MNLPNFKLHVHLFYVWFNLFSVHVFDLCKERNGKNMKKEKKKMRKNELINILWCLQVIDYLTYINYSTSRFQSKIKCNTSKPKCGYKTMDLFIRCFSTRGLRPQLWRVDTFTVCTFVLHLLAWCMEKCLSFRFCLRFLRHGCFSFHWAHNNVEVLCMQVDQRKHKCNATTHTYR